jgi:MFS family permease
MTDIGTALSLLAGGVAIGKLLYGYVSDKFGNAAVLILAAVFKASSMVFLLNYNSGILLMTGAVLLGLATGIIQMVSGLLAGLFGKGDYSSIVGVFSAAMALGMATGAYILGFVHDAKESYHNIFLIYTAAVAFAAFLGLFLNTGIKSLYRGK